MHRTCQSSPLKLTQQNLLLLVHLHRYKTLQCLSIGMECVLALEHCGSAAAQFWHAFEHCGLVVSGCREMASEYTHELTCTGWAEKRHGMGSAREVHQACTVVTCFEAAASERLLCPESNSRRPQRDVRES